MATSGAKLALVDEPEQPGTVWFSASGCVVSEGDLRSVFVGGVLLGSFERGDVATRDAFIGIVTQDRKVKKEQAAEAFSVSTVTVFRAQASFRNGGFVGVTQRRRRGAPDKLTPALERKLRKAFDAGVGPRRGHELVAAKLGYGTVQRLFAKWKQECTAAEPSVAAPATAETSAQMQLFEATPTHDVAPSDADDAEFASSNDVEVSRSVLTEGTQPLVQHAGSWLMLGMLHELGLYELAERHRPREVRAGSLRLALDAAAVALTIGERTIEGARRIATASSSVLLRANRAPSPEWVRRTLSRYAESSQVLLHLGLAQMLLEKLVRNDGRLVLYVDNHLRRYTGKHTIRHGWRMQDKRAVPGITDYYVHDEDGDPVWRVDVPSHDSLAQILGPVARAAKKLVSTEPTVLLVFDRAGAYPECLAQLRDAGVEVVTYERKPYPTLTDAQFDSTLELLLESYQKPERLRYCETSRRNLKGGRGRVRRLAFKTEHGEQVNVLAVSKLPAADLIRALLMRWSRQENKLKHGNERWGINQLDGRRVRQYPEDAIVPNPAHRRLQHRLRLARAAEGELRRKLARVEPDSSRQERLQSELEANLDQQKTLEALRASAPSHAPVRETELADKLRIHEGKLKTVVDTLRVALANCESTLATELAPHLPKPREAKKALANLLSAPGSVRVTQRTVSVRLSPAGTRRELTAFEALLDEVNARSLTLPGDTRRRPLRFAIASD